MLVDFSADVKDIFIGKKWYEIQSCDLIPNFQYTMQQSYVVRHNHDLEVDVRFLVCMETYEFSVVRLRDLRSVKYSNLAFLLKDILGCLLKYSVMVCCTSEEVAGRPWPCLLSTPPVLWKLLTHLRILLRVGGREPWVILKFLFVCVIDSVWMNQTTQFVFCAIENVMTVKFSRYCCILYRQPS